MTPVAIGDTQGTPGSPKPCITSKTVRAARPVSTERLHYVMEKNIQKDISSDCLKKFLDRLRSITWLCNRKTDIQKTIHI